MNFSVTNKEGAEKITGVSDKNKSVIGLLIFAVITIILWQMPFGRYILYPFTILGTWFHEMGHGIAALILGGNFHKLEIYSNGTGLAMHSGSLLFGPIGSAIVAAAGPIGPTIAGAAFILSSRNAKSTKGALLVLGFLLVLSPIIWIRSMFGFFIILAFGIVTIIIALKASNGLRRFTLQFLGVQAILSLYLSIGYLFSSGATVGGNTYYSDTAVMQNHLLLPYWLWGALILAFSAGVIIFSLRALLKD